MGSREHDRVSTAEGSGSGRRFAFQHAAIGMGVVSLDGQWLSVNESLCELSGYDATELIGASWDLMISPGAESDEHLQLGRLLEGMETSYEGEQRLVRKSGDTLLVLLGVSVVRSNQGAPLRLIVQVRDLSAQRRAERARELAEARLTAVVAGAPILLWALDADGRFTLCEGRALGAIGLSPSELIGRSAVDVYRNISVHDVTDASKVFTGDVAVRRAFSGQSVACIAEVNGKLFDTRIEPERDDSGKVTGVIGVATDVTERVLAEAGFRALIERSPGLVAVYRAGRLIYESPALLAALGYSEKAISGRPITEIVHPDDREWVSVQDSQDVNREIHLVRENGDRLPVEAALVSVIFDGEPARALVARDLSEQKRVEAKLLEADRLTSLGMLAAGVAHEVNNPLTYIIANTDFAVRKLEALRMALADRETPDSSVVELERALESLVQVNEGAERVRRLMSDLKAFARGGAEEMTPLDLGSVVKSAIQLAGGEIRSHARLVERLGALPPVLGDEARLSQALVNLLINAAQAIPEDEEGSVTVAGFTDNDGRAVIEISDSGVGIDPEELSSIFKPFYTTKPVGVGTGLGLSIVRRTVVVHGGEISVDSSLGAGSTFRVVLPSTVETPPSSAPLAVHPRPDERLRLLVIDDDAEVVHALARSLEDEHHVAACTSAGEALDLVLKDNQRFDVILCDVMMPIMNGPQFYAELSRDVPELASRVVFMSGAVSRSRSFIESVGLTCIDKPIDLGQLRALIQRR